jgi:hypothetical protein
MEGQMNPEEFLNRLKRDVIGHPALTHPFLERFGDGDVGTEGVRTFAVQYYRHVRVSRLYLAALISNCGHDEALQLALAEVLFDEYGHLDPVETHPALYRRFLGDLAGGVGGAGDAAGDPAVHNRAQGALRAAGLQARARRPWAGERVARAPDLRAARRGAQKGDGAA